MKRLVRRAGAAVALALVASMATNVGQPAQAVDLTLPSLWRAYQDDFVFGTFGDWSSDQAKYHYRTSSPANAIKLDGQIGNSNTNSLSRQAYVAAVAKINADTTLTEAEKADALDQANQEVVLQPTTGPGQSETILKAIQAYNAANNLPADARKVVRAHVLAWHGGQQPNYFFTNGFTYDAAKPDWASPRTMLKRLDNYIRQMMVKYKPYQDIIYSWDVVNEPVDDYTGQIRNGQDAQVGQWGTVFRRPDLDGDPDARLFAESAWVRQAFASARKWSNANGETWKLYLNDYQDSNKLYEPKLSQTIKVLKPIYAAGNIDGYGLQGRLSSAYPTIAQLRAQINAGLTVANEISISESDIRSDLEPNPNYDPTQPTRRVTEADATDPRGQWPDFGSCSWVNRAASNGNTFDVCNSPVRRIPAWGTGTNTPLADSPDVMKKQADFAADWMDLLLSYKGKVKAYQFDGLSDTSTFNRNDGAHLWSGAPDRHEKYSFFSVLGAPYRLKMRDAIAVPVGDAAIYTPASWTAYAAAKQKAQSLVGVRIYDIAAVNDVTAATAALKSATTGLVLLNPPATPGTGTPGTGTPGTGTPGTGTTTPGTTTPGTPGTTAPVKVSVKTKVTRAATTARRGKLKVKLAPSASGAVTVQLKKGDRTITRTLQADDGTAVLTLPELGLGTWKVKVSFAGTTTYAALPLTRAGSVRVTR